jgi:hypothetical protein
MDVVMELAAEEGIKIACCLSAACARACGVCRRKKKKDKHESCVSSKPDGGQLHQPGCDSGVRGERPSVA